MFFNSLLLILPSVYCVQIGWGDIENNYTIFEITAFNTRERAVLYHMQTTNDAVIFLNGVTNIISSPMYVIVSDCCTDDFSGKLDEAGIEYVKVLKDSVLQEFHEMKADIHNADDLKNVPPLLHKEFLNWNEIKLWIRHLLKKYSVLKKLTIGATFEGRELFVLKLSSGLPKPAVFLLGGEQGRDKMSVSIILNFLNNILTTKTYLGLTNVYDIYLMPVFNPDGYEFSMETAWLWNKNRKHFYPEKTCPQYDDKVTIGVNVDRNWFMSNSGYVEGAECDSVFIGHEPLTEEESRALSMFLNSLAENLMAFINVRGFGSLLTVPYAEPNEFANNYAVLSEMLLHASNAAFIKYNVSCNLCSTHNCFYNYTGNAPDWVKRNMNVPVVFTLYLKQGSSFLPQVEQISTLVQQYGIIVKETLLLAYDIYGPLFNGAIQLRFTVIIVTALISLN